MIRITKCVIACSAQLNKEWVKREKAAWNAKLAERRQRERTMLKKRLREMNEEDREDGRKKREAALSPEERRELERKVRICLTRDK